MRFYINFCTNVMSGLPLWCTDLRFGLPRASPPLQSPFHSSFSLLLDFLLPPLHFKVQSAALSRPFWTSAHLPTTSKSNPPLFLARSFWTSAHLPSTSKSIPPLFLAPFGLPPVSPPLQSPILRSFSLLLDFRVPPLHFKVHSAALSHSTTQKRRIAKQSASLNQPIQSSISQFHQVKHLQ